MQRRHKAYYMRTVVDQDGNEKQVPYCVYCDVPMYYGHWPEVRQGILYICYGWVCPECGNREEERYVMVGKPDAKG